MQTIQTNSLEGVVGGAQRNGESLPKSPPFVPSPAEDYVGSYSSRRQDNTILEAQRGRDRQGL
ncbi:MAG: hypothetical protein QM831_19825 [Kofleriaceae bacterium]